MAANFTMFAGDTKLLQVRVSDPANAPVDITGTKVRWELAKTVKDEPSLIYKAVGSGITIVDGVAGRFDVLLEPPDTYPLKGSYYYEAEIDDGGVISTVLTGQVQINPALIDPIAVAPDPGIVGSLNVILERLVSVPVAPIIGTADITLGDTVSTP